MVKRIYFPLVILFWVIMNTLLWRSEMSGRQNQGSRIPVETVWERILTAPDDSSLQILHHGRKVGFCRWVATINEVARPTGEVDERAIEGRVRDLSGYTIDFDGNFLFEESVRRMRFACQIEFGTNQVWRKFLLRLTLKPNTWEVRADAAREQVRFRVDDGGAGWERSFSFAELARPEQLIASFGLPSAAAWMAAAVQGMGVPEPSALALGLAWEARSDWLRLGHTRLRVSRVEARLLDKYRVHFVISRVGEILRVELPDDLVLVNEALANYPKSDD